MIEQLAGYMQSKGYQKMITNVPGLLFLFRQEMQSVNVVITMEYRAGGGLSPEQYRHIKQQMREAFERRGVGELHAMALMITDEPETARVLCGEERFCWLIDKAAGKLIIYERQVVDFYGLKAMLEEFLVAWTGDPCAAGADGFGAAWTDDAGAPEAGARRTGRPDGNGADAAGANGAGVTETRRQGAFARTGQEKQSLGEVLRRLPIMTILLVAVNCVVFLMCTWGGGVLYNKGELLGRALTEQGEYYRIVTSMFLHADTGHLFSNMLMLYALGSMLERHFKRVGYTLLYFLSGAGAAAASVWHQLQVGSLVGSIGASGAVYGLIGALLFLVIAGRGRFESVTLPRVLLCIAYSLYSGFMAENIDNAAHIGGFLCGFILTALLMLGKDGKA
ncbi:MAG: rhomboid family intramembrane serine protease [bacterium]|nr:rhomboid family intramembrane serine protease [bacterium]